MSSEITHVQPGSIADRLGLRAGDMIERIAGEPVIDQIDYQALTAQERFDIDISRNGQALSFHVDKEDWEPLGVTLDQSIVSRPRPCRNHCPRSSRCHRGCSCRYGSCSRCRRARRSGRWRADHRHGVRLRPL